MASGPYLAGLDAILTGAVNLTGASALRACLVDTGTYTVDLATHNALDDLSGIVATGTIASATVSGGVFDAADLVLTGVTGSTAEAVVIYLYNATASLATLLFYFDGLSVTPNGGNITITWDSGTNKIVKFS